MDDDNDFSREEAIIAFLKLPQEYDYMMISPLQAKKQLKSKYLREKIFEAKGTVCESCGSDKNITIHHRTYELVMPKGLRRLTVYSSHSHRFTLRVERCEAHNRQISKKNLLYANEDHKWQLIERKFPDFFKQTINNMDVLCWNCHQKKHREYEKETGSFMPLHSYHKEGEIETERIKHVQAKVEITPKSISNYHERMAKIKENYPNAYEPWTSEADNKLKILYSEGKQTKELCDIFGRQPGGIRSRLKKIGLVE